MLPYGTKTLGTAAGLPAIATSAAVVAGDDNNDLPNGTCLGLLVGTTGDIKVTTAQGDTLVLKSVPAGILPLRVVRVWSTLTTASNMTALY